MVSILLASIAFCFPIQPVGAQEKTWVVDDDGPADFAKIQDAVNAAIGGDTIKVKAGVYNENVLVQSIEEVGDKDITLVGEDRKSILNGSFFISADSAAISGFTISSLITIDWNAHLDISDNTVLGGIDVGMFSGGPSSASIINNTIENIGIVIDGEGYICNNSFVNCEKAISAGFYINALNNTIINSDYAFNLYKREDGSSFFINNNFVNNCKFFLKYDISYDCKIEVKENTITGCNYGIYLNNLDTVMGPTGLKCFNNNFINIITNVYLPEVIGSTEWNTVYPQGGNYWSDYNGTDNDGDGIGDSPYIIDQSNKDNYPLMRRWSPIAFSDGFESGSFTRWNGTYTTSGETVSISTTRYHHGSYGSSFRTNSGGGYEKAYGYRNISGTPELYARGYFYVSQSGIVDINDRFFFLIFSSGNNNLAYAGLRKTSTGTTWCLTTRQDTGYIDTYSSTVPTIVGKWYCVELHWKKDGANGLSEMWVDGTKVCSVTNKNTATYGGATQLKFGIAETYGVASTTVYADCITLSSNYIGTEPPNGSLTVTSPNGGENWARGTAHTITWSSVGSAGSSVKIELLKAGAVNRVITSSTANDGSYSWTVPSTQTQGTDYKIRVTSTSNSVIQDSSNANFSITSGTTRSLTVTSPNGGESWARSTVHTITWSSVGSVGSYVKIELLKAGAVNRVITSSTTNDGSYSWTVPSTQTLGADYTVRITSSSNVAIKDSSNSNFTIR